MTQLGRMRPETLAEFVESGLATRGWVNPLESPAGYPLSLDPDHAGWSSGAFLCQRTEELQTCMPDPTPGALPRRAPSPRGAAESVALCAPQVQALE